MSTAIPEAQPLNAYAEAADILRRMKADADRLYDLVNLHLSLTQMHLLVRDSCERSLVEAQIATTVKGLPDALRGLVFDLAVHNVRRTVPRRRWT